MSRRRRIRIESTRSELDALSRALKLSSRGEARRALVLLREACLREEENASLWTQYAVLCAKHGKDADALSALNHAAWLRERAHQPRRAEVTRTLRARLDPHRTAA